MRGAKPPLPHAQELSFTFTLVIHGHLMNLDLPSYKVRGFLGPKCHLSKEFRAVCWLWLPPHTQRIKGHFVIFKILLLSRAVVAQSVQCLAMEWSTFDTRGKRIFPLTPYGAHLVSCPMGTGGHYPGSWYWPLTPSSAEVKNEWELYLLSHLRLHSCVVGLPLPFTFTIKCLCL
jgi:hypothetical protein